VDLRTAKPLSVNQFPPTCFQGQTPGITEGYVVDAEGLRALTTKADGSRFYIHPLLGGQDLLNRSEVGRWIMDLDQTDSLLASQAAPTAWSHLVRHVLPERQRLAETEVTKNREGLAKNPKYRPETQH
jgi:hypothetical protein